MEDVNKNSKISAFGERLSEAIDALNFKKQADFARDIEVSSPSLNQYIKNGIKPSGEVTLRIIQKYPNVNWYYVYFGEGKINEEMPIANLTLLTKIKDLETENKELKSLLETLTQNLDKEKSTNLLLQRYADLLERYEKKIHELETK